jgi:hypothetical protein
VDPVATLERLGGYATRAGLVKAGVTRHSIYRALDSARIVRLRRGIYGLGLPDGTQLLAAASTALAGTVSHDSAAVLWDLEIVHQPDTWVTVARDRSRASYPGVRVRRAAVDETAVRHGLQVTTPLRTVLDCAQVLSTAHAVVIADSALRKGLVTIDELQSAAATVIGRHAARVRRVAALADPRCGSVLEFLLRFTWEDIRLEPDYVVATVRHELAKTLPQPRRRSISTQRAACERWASPPGGGLCVGRSIMVDEESGATGHRQACDR